MKSWFFGKKEESLDAGEEAKRAAQAEMAEEQKGEDGEDSLDDEFFDCVDTEQSEVVEETKGGEPGAPASASKRSTRNSTAFTLNFNIKELSLTLGKLSASNKIDGIQIYNRSVDICTRSPTLNISQTFVTQAKIDEWGVSLITLNRRTNQIEESVEVIQTNKSERNEDNSKVAQWDMTLVKNDTAASQDDIEFDLAL